jgi:hypothetical protein
VTILVAKRSTDRARQALALGLVSWRTFAGGCGPTGTGACRLLITAVTPRIDRYIAICSPAAPYGSGAEAQQDQTTYCNQHASHAVP